MTDVLSSVCAGQAKPRGAAEGDVRTLLCRLWARAAGAGRGNRGSRHHAPQHLLALSAGQGERDICFHPMKQEFVQEII